MYREGSNIQFLYTLIASTPVGDAVNVLFENGLSTCYVAGDKTHNILPHNQMSKAAMRVAISAIQNDHDFIVKTKLTREDSKFLHLWRIK